VERHRSLRDAETGFHSNDVRGAAISVDPVSGEAVDRMTPLVRANSRRIRKLGMGTNSPTQP
jgi:hypothetical protein